MTKTSDMSHSRTTPKRRTSSLTWVILTVNILPLLLMGFGVFYLDQYKQNLIQFAFQRMEQKSILLHAFLKDKNFDLQQLEIKWPANEGAAIVDKDGHISSEIGSIQPIERKNDHIFPLEGIISFTDLLAEVFITLNPLRTSLPLLPDRGQDPYNPAQQFPEIIQARSGQAVLSAWAHDQDFILTIALPLEQERVLFMTMSGAEIVTAINDVRIDIVRALIIVLIFTFLLSIYLSSHIAIPLKKLGRAAEDIRRGRKDLTTLPDMGKRKDEIGELSQILRQMTAALDLRIDTMAHFAADVAHELKNPLTSLRSAIETAVRIEDADKRTQLLQVMIHDVTRLDRLISDISRHSRLDSELARESFEVVDIKNILRDAVNMMSLPYLAPARQNLIKLHMPDEVCLTYGKGDSLTQVFINILANALSFSPENESILVHVLLEPEWVVIKVEDKGRGITPGLETKIFDRFYKDRSDQSLQSTENSGLGLAISQQIIRAHRGHIRAENITSAVQSDAQIIGARFIIYLPRYISEA